MSPANQPTKKTVATKKRTVTKSAAKKAAPKKNTARKTSAKTAPKKATKKTKKAPVAAKPGKKLKPKRKDTISNTFTKGHRKPFSFPQSVSLSVIAMPRLPIDVDTLAIGLARYGGMAFVLIGAYFTLYHADAVGLTWPLVATVIDASAADNISTVPFVAQNPLLLVTSIAVVSVGLVLLLLGLHMQQRRDKLAVTKKKS